MKHGFLVAAMAASVAAYSVDSRAQAWLADRRFAEGIGVRTGNLELHPGVGAEFGYDSNWFQRSENDPFPIAPALRLRVTPSLSLATIDRQRELNTQQQVLSFRLAGAASYNELIGLKSETKDEINDQRYIAGGVNGELSILPHNKWGADLDAGYTRTVEPSNLPDTADAWNRSVVQGGAALRWMPGGGLFRWRAGYNIRATFFENNPFEGYDNLQHMIATTGRWLFLPRSALVFQGDYTLVRYSNTTPQNNGDLVRGLVGYNGLVTNHLGVLALAGWGASFYDPKPAIPAENFDSVIGQAELTWYFTPQEEFVNPGESRRLSHVAVGYNRNFQNSYFGSYYQQDRVYANLSFFWAGAFVTTLGGGYSRINRPNIYLPGAPTGGESDVDPACGCVLAYGENRLDASLFAEYRVSDSVGINTTVRYNANMDSVTVGVDDLNFSRWQAYLGLRWFL